MANKNIFIVSTFYDNYANILDNFIPSQSSDYSKKFVKIFEKIINLSFFKFSILYSENKKTPKLTNQDGAYSVGPPLVTSIYSFLNEPIRA